VVRSGPPAQKKRHVPEDVPRQFKQRKTDDYPEFGHAVADNYGLAIRPAGV